ncbi:MAG: ABC transporter substrate-binding protein [Archaeoglobaceae archaeon]|nr:ABC transporter substrate-binding protein [Archaeoglobaceae archaeon]MDW7989868.1 ABC transporter substrate-binding protein [Archaeoglobaceae archaeon]
MIIFTFLISGCVQQKEDKEDKEIKIGVLVPKTGEFSSAGIVMENAAKLAEKHAKEIFGVNIRVVIADCGDKPETAKTAFVSLAQQGVVAVVGAYSSPQALVVADTANELKVVYIASVASADLESKIREGNRYVFRNAYNTSYWGVLAAEFLRITNAKSYYLIGYDPLRTFNTAMFILIKNSTKAELKGEDWFKSPSVAPEDYKRAVEKALISDAEVIILGDPGATSVSFVREYAMKGGKATIYSVGGTLALMSVLRGLGIDNIAFQAAAIEGEEKTKLTKRYFENYREIFKEDANNYAGLLTYDAILIVAQAKMKGNLIEELEKGSFFGAAGIYTFENHQAQWGSEKLRGSIGIFRSGKVEILT